MTRVGVRTELTTPPTSISTSACNSMRVIVGLAPARWARPYISLKPGTSAIGPKKRSARAPSPQWDSISSFIASGLLGSPTPWVIRQLGAEAGHGAVQRERLDTLRIGGREQDAHRASLGDAEKRRAIDSDGIHHGLQVIHPLVKGRHVSRRIRKSGAALVPHDQPGATGESLDERHKGQRRVGPQIDIADPAGYPHQSGVSLAEHAIGEPHRTVTGVMHSAVLHVHILTVMSALRQRKPMWLMPVSTICGRRAAGR